jgi:hypothetical protein
VREVEILAIRIPGNTKCLILFFHSLFEADPEAAREITNRHRFVIDLQSRE